MGATAAEYLRGYLDGYVEGARDLQRTIEDRMLGVTFDTDRMAAKLAERRDTLGDVGVATSISPLLKFSLRTDATLYDNGVRTMGDLLALRVEDLRYMTGMGESRVHEVRNKLWRFGLTLHGDDNYLTHR